MAVGMPPLSMSLLLFPDSAFSLAVAPAQPHHEERTSGVIGMARRAQGKPPKATCAQRVESALSENWLLRSGVAGEVRVAAGMHKDSSTILYIKACPQTRRSPKRPRTNMATCCGIWTVPRLEGGSRGSGKGPGWGWLLQLLLPFSAFFCLLLWEPWP